MPGIEHDPTPEALVHELGISTVDIRAMLWTNSRRHGSITVPGAASKAVKSRLDRDGIEMPANIGARDPRRRNPHPSKPALACGSRLGAEVARGGSNGTQR